MKEEIKDYINCFRNDKHDLTIWSILMAIISIPLVIPFLIIYLIFFKKIA